METYLDDHGNGRTPDIPGCDPVRRLGGGASGTVWLVQPRDGTGPWAAKCLRPDPAGSGADGHNESEITQEWRILAQYDHEHLVRVHDVVPLGGDDGNGWALLMDYAAGGSVRDIVAARGPLTPGEVVTVLTPLGGVLSYLHGRGVVHGDVSPGNVLLTAHGKPLLGDLGCGRMTGQPHDSPGGTPGFSCAQDVGATAAADVYAMAAVGWYALTGSAPPPARERMPLSLSVPGVPAELAAALEAGLAENAAQRPTPAALAQAVFRSARAEPVALAQAVHPSVLPDLLTRRRPREPRRRGPGRLFPKGGGRPSVHGLPSWLRRHRSRHLSRRWITVAAGIAVLAAVLSGWQLVAGSVQAGVPELAGGGTPTAVSVPPSADGGSAAALAALGAVAGRVPGEIRNGLVSEDPAKALPALAWLRSYALSTANASLLVAVNAPGSPALKADTATLRALTGAKHSYSGLETTVSAAREQSRSKPAGAAPATATVAATVTTSPFAENDATGAVVYQQQRQQQQKLRIVLVLLRGRWVIQEILPAGGNGAR